MRAVHQFVPTLHRGDAVGRHTLRLRDAFRARGVPSRIFVETPDPDTAAESQPYLTYADVVAPGDVLVYQLATASGMAAWLGGRTETLVVNYHNVTPPEYYAPWDNALALHQLRAQAELDAVGAARLARRHGFEVRRGGAAPRRLRAHGGRAARGGPPNPDRPDGPHRSFGPHRPVGPHRPGGPRAHHCVRPRPRCAVGERGSDRSQQGPSVRRRRAPRGPPSPRRAGHARHRRPARRAGVRARLAPLHRRARPAPRRDVSRGGGRRRAGRPARTRRRRGPALRTRRLRRSRGRGPGGGHAGRGQPGRGVARGARRCRRPRRREGPVRPGSRRGRGARAA